MATFLCLILDSAGAEIKEFHLESHSEWNAKHLAKCLFEDVQHYTPSLRKHGFDWTIDVVEI